MNSYEWDIKNIERKLNELERGIETDKARELDIITYNEMLGKSSADGYLSFNITQDEEMKKLQPLFLELASKFYKSSLFKDIELPGFENIWLSDDDILNLIHDFYKTCSSHFYNCFLEAFNQRNTHLQIRSNLLKSSATTYHLLSEKGSYIKLDRSNTIFDSINLAYGYGHAVTFLMNPNFITNPNFTLVREVDGLFFQTQFIDYLIENNIFKEEAILAKTVIDMQMNRRAHLLQAHEFNLFDVVYFCSYLANMEICMTECQHPEELLDMIMQNNPQSLSEGLGFLTSYSTLNETAAAFQKKIKKQLDQNFIH